MSGLKPYGFGDEVVVVVLVPGDEDVFTLVSVLVAAPGSFTTVVLFSVLLSAGGLVTVVSFFSQAGISAAKARRQMYFFIRGLTVKRPALINEIKGWPLATRSSSYRSRLSRSGLPPASRLQFSFHKPRATRPQPECRCISS